MLIELNCYEIQLVRKSYEYINIHTLPYPIKRICVGM